MSTMTDPKVQVQLKRNFDLKKPSNDNVFFFVYYVHIRDDEQHFGMLFSFIRFAHMWYSTKSPTYTHTN